MIDKVPRFFIKLFNMSELIDFLVFSFECLTDRSQPALMILLR